MPGALSNLRNRQGGPVDLMVMKGSKRRMQRIQCTFGNVQLGLRTRCTQKFHFAIQKFMVPSDFHEAIAVGSVCIKS